MDHAYLGRKLSKIGTLLNGRITASYHCEDLITKHRKRPVAHGTGAYAASASRESLLVFEPKPVGRRTSGDNDRVRSILRVILADDGEGPAGKIDSLAVMLGVAVAVIGVGNVRV